MAKSSKAPNPKCDLNKTGSSETVSKIASVIALMERDQGTTLDEMVEATGWQPHSTRAALTGLRKKGHDITRTVENKVSRYRLKGQTKGSEHSCKIGAA